MISAILEASQVVFQMHHILLIIGGSLLGHMFGLMPGLSGMIAVAILIPLSYNMGLATAMIFLISILGGGTFAGSITAILLGIPGQAMNAMTVIDGHPLAKQGKGVMAVGASATSSAMGSLLSLVILALTIPIISKIVLLFSPPEEFVIIVIGLIAIAMASRDAFVNGMIGGFLGILISFIGYNNIVGGLRFTYGLDYLWDGVPMIPVFVGLYAVTSFIDLGRQRGKRITQQFEAEGKGLLEGVIAVFKNWFLWLRCSIIGMIVGAIPGLGGDTAAVICYSHAVQTEKNTENFGKGDIRGVIAPEAANNSKDGGQLMPTFGLGIPGSVAMAILLGAFLIHGIKPGTNMFAENLDIIWITLIAYAISNIFTSFFGMAAGAQIARLIMLPSATYMPIVVVLGMLGAYVSNYSMGDMIATLMFGVLGYALKVYNIPRVPFIIGYILGPLAEKFYFQSLQIARGSYFVFVNNSVTIIVLWALLIISMISYWQPWKKMTKGS